MRATEEIPMRITVSLTRDEYNRLQEHAKAERRPLRSQAEVLIAEGLKRQTPKNQEARVP